MASPYRVSPPNDGVAARLGTAGASTTDAVTGTSTGLSWPVTPGTYMLYAHLSLTTALATTAPQFAMIRGSGCTLTHGSISTYVATTAIASESGNVTSTADGFTAGQTGSGANERPTVISGMFTVATAGTLTLQIRSEVGGSAVTMLRGCGTLTRIA